MRPTWKPALSVHDGVPYERPEGAFCGTIGQQTLEAQWACYFSYFTLRSERPFAF